MRGRRHKLAVSTFPFLAVLLCAMGSLILILLVMDRKAHQAAQARARREAIAAAEENARSAAMRKAEIEREKQQARAAWEQKRDALHTKLSREQIEMQLKMRKIREQLGEITARLRYEQDTSTELRRKVGDERDKLRNEQQLLTGLRSDAAHSASQAEQSNKTLQHMTADLLRMEQALKDLKAARQRQQHTFSVIPYHGRRGENRRPIYVECDADGVIFHPGHRAMPVTTREFLVGHDNPNAPPDDVRAEVERRIARQQAKTTNTGKATDATPYLLLLVRPDGIGTYHVFQHALRGMDLDFGYEFIDADWILDFPADDEQPSNQPWMTATKTPTSPATPTAKSQRTAPHPIAMTPNGGYGLQGIRTKEGNGQPGRWLAPGSGGSGRPGNSTASGGSNSAAGSGNGSVSPGGSAYPAGGTPSLTARAKLGASASGGGQPGGLFAPLGGGGNSSSSPSLVGGGNAAANSSAVNSGVAWSPNRGGGRGHPSALAPVHDGGGGGGGGFGIATAGGTPGRGGGGVAGKNALGGVGQPYDPGAALSGAFASSPSSPTSLGTPQALPAAWSAGVSSNAGGSGTGGTGYAQNGGTASQGGNASGSIGNSGSMGSGTTQGGTGGTGGNGIAANGATGGGSSASPGSPNGRYVAAGTSTTGGSNGSQGVGNSSSTATGLMQGVGGGMGGNGIAANGATGGGSPGSPTSPNGRYVAGGTSTTTGSGGSRFAGNSNSPANGSPQGNAGGRGGNGVAANGTTTGGSPSSPTPPNGQYVAAGASTTGNQTSSGTPGTTAGQGTPGSSGANGYSGQSPSNPSQTANAIVDPLMPKQPRGLRPSDRGEEPPPPSDAPPNPPRGKVTLQHGGLGGSGGGSGPPSTYATPSYRKPKRKPAALRPAWVHGGRDWTIYVECLAGGVKLYPSERTFPLAQAAYEGKDNPLTTAIRRMIDRRQAGRRRDEPPYYPRVCLLVRPENIRTFLKVYPALEALPVPKMRLNLDADADVRDIVTGANP